MNEKNYKYDAFISYRHSDLDKFVAENLHKILENYNLPKNLKKKLNIQGRTIKRVFRDQEELPLSSNLEDPIIAALNDSKYLIVICSPRLKDSLWCKKEIETFKKLRGRKNIFCVLIEGEPSDSFPEEVLYDEIEIKKDNGKIKKEKVLVEPLAADVRGNSKKEVLKKIKSEKLRLIAPMYNLEYDDLKQRHKQRKQKKILVTSLIVAISCLLFAIYTSIMLIRINSQQKILKLHQADSLSNKAIDSLQNDSRYDAIKLSYQALTEFDGVKMPYTSKAEYALVESLGIYDVGSSYKTISELKTKGVASYIKSSEDKEYALVYDESEELTLFNTKTLKKIKTISLNGAYFNENSFSFIGNNLFAYINKDGNIIILNSKDGSIYKEIKKVKDSYSALKGDKKGEYLSYVDKNNVYIYDINQSKTIGSVQDDNNYLNNMYYSEDNKYLFASTKKENYNLKEEDYIKVHIIDLTSAKKVNSTTINASFISGMLTKDDNVYMLFNRSFDTSFNMIVVSYNYKDNKINWSKSFDKNFGKFITRSYNDNSNSIAVVNYQTVNVLNEDTGEVKEVFNADSEIVGIYSFIDEEVYLIFLKNGSVNFIYMKDKNIIEYKGKFEMNLSDYSSVTQSNNGFLMIPKNDNRVILYEPKTNKNAKKEDIKLDYVKDDSIPLSGYDKVKEEYSIKNKSLVEKIFYSDKKELLFVNFINKDLAIYSVKNKKLLNKIDKLGKVSHYFGKDKYGRIYVGDVSDSYILDKDYEMVGHIKSLRKLEKNKVIISNNNKFYSIKIYNLNEILEEAKNYLK